MCRSTRRRTWRMLQPKGPAHIRTDAASRWSFCMLILSIMDTKIQRLHSTPATESVVRANVPQFQSSCRCNGGHISLSLSRCDRRAPFWNTLCMSGVGLRSGGRVLLRPKLDGGGLGGRSTMRQVDRQALCSDLTVSKVRSSSEHRSNTARDLPSEYIITCAARASQVGALTCRSSVAPAALRGRVLNMYMSSAHTVQTRPWSYHETSSQWQARICITSHRRRLVQSAAAQPHPMINAAESSYQHRGPGPPLST